MEGSFEPYPGLLEMVRKKKKRKLPQIIFLINLLPIIWKDYQRPEEIQTIQAKDGKKANTHIQTSFLSLTLPG